MEQLSEQTKLEILCSYLPYGVEVEITIKESGVNINPRQRLTINNIASLLPINPRPILRHPDDMTEEESDKYRELWESDSNFIKSGLACLQYLWSLHIDTFGAIEAGWAVRKNK